MRIAICEDSEKELAYVSELLVEYQRNRGADFNCRSFHSSTDFLCDVKGGEYDLVLLDVVMPGISGVQAAQELRDRDRNVRIIFMSFSPEFAVESYHVGAYYYLLKPLGADSLFPLLDRVREELHTQEEQGFVLKNRKGVVRIPFTGLEYVEVINKTVSFHLASGVIHEATAALGEFEEKLLDRPEFLKTHRSFLVNLNYVQAMEEHCIVTRNNHRIPLSRQRRRQVQAACLQFLHQTDSGDLRPAGQPEVSAGEPKISGGPWRILLVDDEEGDRMYWADILRRHGCMTELAENGEQALKLAEGRSWDCVLLDVMIPGEDGFSVCEKLQKQVQAPVIFLSCLTESERQVEGFAAGGIDYITKDTPAGLFWAKVETRIRLAVSERTQFCYGPLLLDLKERRVLIDGKELLLTPVEFDILWKLSEHSEHIFTMKEISDLVWGEQHWDGGQTVQIHVSRLRRKLEKAWEEHEFIESVWGEGYRFVPAEP